MKYIFVFIFLLNQFLSAEPSSYTQIEDRSDLHILTPSLQDQVTEKIRLSNGLSIYLVHDPRIDQSAAAVSVNVGSWNDPDSYPGMAHFLEHMLFKGTHTYPKANGFFEHIANYAGSFNAYTAPDRTVYMFSSNHEGFEEGLNQFSHFFIDPLFPLQEVEKELFVVDQEHQKNIENDSWRLYMISKQIGNPNHPNAKFSTGNSETLRKIPPSALQNWFEEHYSANLMNLTVISPLPIDKLKQQVIAKFSPIPNRGHDPVSTNQSLSLEENRKTITYVKPIREMHRIYIEIELPKLYALDQSKSVELVAYALKRGQNNNLEQVLIRKNLIEKLSIYPERIGSNHCLFEMEIELTEQGLKDPIEVISICFDAISQLRKEGIPFYLYEEMQKMKELTYLYQQREDPFEFVQEYASHLVDEDLSTFPRKTLLGSGYNPSKVQDVLEYLTIDNGQIYLLCNSKHMPVSLDRTEKWMQAKYTTKDLSLKELTKISQPSLSHEIRIAPKNPFLPETLQLVELENPTPLQLVDHPSGQVYLAQEQEFISPEVCFHFHILSPLIQDGIRSLTLSDLFLEHLQTALRATLSCGKNANLNALFNISQCKLNISIEGFSEKAPLFTQMLFKEMKANYPTQKMFEQLKARLMKVYANTEKELPIRQANEVLASILFSNRATSQEHLMTLQKITYEEYLQFQNNLFKQCYLQGFFAGNITSEQAKKLVSDVQRTLYYKLYPKDLWHSPSIFSFPSNLGPYKVSRTTQAFGSGCLLALDFGSFSFKKRASQEILGQVLRETFFNELRSKQKTGYLVRASALEKNKRLFQTFSVQSSSHLPDDLLYRFELYLENFLQTFSSQVSLSRFEKLKQNQIVKLQTLIRNLSTKAAVLDKLAFEHKDLNWIEKRIKGLQSLSYDEFTNNAFEFLSKENRRRIAVLMNGKTQDDLFRYQEMDQKELVNMH